VQSFKSQDRLKRPHFPVIGNQGKKNQIKSLRKVIMAFNGNSHGLLTAEDMRDRLKKTGFKETL